MGYDVAFLLFLRSWPFGYILLRAWAKRRSGTGHGIARGVRVTVTLISELDVPHETWGIARFDVYECMNARVWASRILATTDRFQHAHETSDVHLMDTRATCLSC
jgi:hypothetical protein